MLEVKEMYPDIYETTFNGVKFRIVKDLPKTYSTNVAHVENKNVWVCVDVNVTLEKAIESVESIPYSTIEFMRTKNLALIMEDDENA